MLQECYQIIEVLLAATTDKSVTGDLRCCHFPVKEQTFALASREGNSYTVSTKCPILDLSAREKVLD